jgi:hypothetical protein
MGRKLQILTLALLAWAFMPVISATAQTWSQLTTVGSPPALPGNAENYDSSNNRLIVFFGRWDTLPSDEVWILTNANGLGGTSTWTQLQPTGTAPTINGDATAVYDASANQLVVYGGCSDDCGSALSNVYVLTHANGLGGTPAWSQSSPNTSIPRDGQTAVYDLTTNSMITFGGNLAFPGTDQNDTNVLSPANGRSPTWTTLAPSGGPPGAREAATAVYDRAHNLMILFGGLISYSSGDNSDYNDVWTLSGANGQGGTPTWTQLQPQGALPPGRSVHTAVYDSAQNAMYVFGGELWSQTAQSYTTLGDVWKLTNANELGSGAPTWTQIGQLGTPPGGNSNYDHGVGYDAVNKRMIVFGGEDRNGVPHNLTFLLDLKQH